MKRDILTKHGLKFIRNKGSLMGRVFANGPGDLGSTPGLVIPKTFKIVLDTSLLNKDKVEQSRERSSALPYTSV